MEFGPGTGAFTRAIAPRLRPGSRYLGIELNPNFCATLARAFPTLDIANANVTDFESLLDARGISTVDAIISGLPWASLPVALQDAVFPAIARRLSPGGLFTTFAYLHALPFPAARTLRHRLQSTFKSVTLAPPTWPNLPPATCYICKT